MIVLALIALAMGGAGPRATLPQGLPGQRARESQQEALGPRRAGERILMPGENFIQRLLTAEQADGRAGDVLDSILKAHPELRRAILRELFIPSPPPDTYAYASAQDAWRTGTDMPMTAFERMSLVKSHEMIVRDRWTESRIRAPGGDISPLLCRILELIF
jgi:hypothetical protein